jgi:hypothetical protein
VRGELPLQATMVAIKRLIARSVRNFAEGKVFSCERGGRFEKRKRKRNDALNQRGILANRSALCQSSPVVVPDAGWPHEDKPHDEQHGRWWCSRCAWARS